MEESAQSGKFVGNLAHDFIPCVLHLFVSLYLCICVCTAAISTAWSHSGARHNLSVDTSPGTRRGGPYNTFSTLSVTYQLYGAVLHYVYCALTYVCTHVDPHALDREHPDWRPLVRHEPVKLVPTLITQNICSSKNIF